MNSFVSDLFERLASEAGRLVRYNKQATLTSREIQTATRLIFPGELAKHGVSEGVKAVTKYTGTMGKVENGDSPAHPADSAYIEAAPNTRQALEEIDESVSDSDNDDSNVAIGHSVDDEFQPPAVSQALFDRRNPHAQMSRSFRAGLVFPVGRFYRLLKEGKYAARVGAGAPVYVAAVLEYLCAEILELSGNAAYDNNCVYVAHVSLVRLSDRSRRIVPRHLQLAIRSDEELTKLLMEVSIAPSGVITHAHNTLLPKKKFENVEETKESNESLPPFTLASVLPSVLKCGPLLFLFQFHLFLNCFSSSGRVHVALGCH